MDPITKQIKIVNQKLKQQVHPIRLERRDNRLWARATLPVKPHLAHRHTQPYQQRICLNLPANLQGVAEAHRHLIKIGCQLVLGEFEWSDWAKIKEPDPGPDRLVGDWVEEFERRYWLSHNQNPSGVRTWKNYAILLAKLPINEPLTIDLLIGVIAKSEPNSSYRKRLTSIYIRLAKMAGLNYGSLKELSGNYSSLHVSPRDLPEDTDIIEAVDRLFDEGSSWSWVVGIMACYGLRNHEVFHLDLLEFPNIFVGAATKTGRRFVYCPDPSWLDRWGLQDRKLPPLDEIRKANPTEWDNARLGRKVGRAFSRAGLLFNPYDLRHAFARRCFENRFPPDLAARVMGHSLQVHTRVYRAWWGEESYRQVYEQVLLERKI